MHRSPWFPWLLFATALVVLGLPGWTMAQQAPPADPGLQVQPASVDTTPRLVATVTLDDPFKRITDTSKLAVVAGKEKTPLQATPAQDPATGKITLQIEIPEGLDPAATSASVLYDDKPLQSIPLGAIEAQVSSDYVFTLKVSGWPRNKDTLDTLRVSFTGGADPKNQQATAAEIVQSELNDGLLVVKVKKPAALGPGLTMVRISQANTSRTGELWIPAAAFGPDQQPTLADVSPRGGTAGSTMILTGQNFGANIEQIKVGIYRDGDSLPVFTTPLSLSSPDPGNQNQQTLRFHVPAFKNLENTLSEPAVLQIEVNGRPSERLPISLLHSDWNLKILGITLAPMAVFLLLMFAAPFRSLANTLFIEAHTKTYSLSRTQAFLWTLILMGSYLYLAIGNGLAVNRGVIPDFNASLLGLMSISYGGLITSSVINRKYPKNEIIDRPASWMDLISEGRQLSLPRIQLAGFTLIAAGLYVYNMKNVQLVQQGLPEVPPVLQGLMGISQLGYLAGHAAGQRTAINFVRPRWIQVGSAAPITLIGTGFVPGTKALFEEEMKAIDTEVSNESTLSLTTPKFRSSGEKKLFLLPPGRSLVPVPGCVYVLSPPTLEVTMVSDRKARCTLTNFPPGDLVGTIGNYSVSVGKIEEFDTPRTVVRYVDLPEELKSPQRVRIATADGRFEATAEPLPQADPNPATA